MVTMWDTNRTRLFDVAGDAAVPPGGGTTTKLTGRSMTAIPKERRRKAVVGILIFYSAIEHAPIQYAMTRNCGLPMGHGWNYRAIFKRDRMGLCSKGRSEPSATTIRRSSTKSGCHLASIHMDKGHGNAWIATSPKMRRPKATSMERSPAADRKSTEWYCHGTVRG